MSGRYPPELLALRAATGALVRAVGGQEACVGFATRIKRHQTFSDMAAPEGDKWMGVDTVVELETVARGTPGWPQVTRYLAQQQGAVLVMLPPVPDQFGGALHAAIAGLAKEAGDVVSETIQRLADGKFCGADKAAALKEIDEAAQQLMTLRALVEQAGDE